MKSKVLGAIKLITAAFVLILSCVILASNFLDKASGEDPAVSGEYKKIDDTYYSAVYEDNTILNVEKIVRSPSGVITMSGVNTKESNTAADLETIKYDGVPNSAVQNGGYLWLKKAEGAGKPAESVLITLGRYIYNADEDKVELDPEDKYAGIKSLTFVLKHYKNGMTASDQGILLSESPRNINIGGQTLAYLDMAIELPNDDDVEGYYEIDVVYMTDKTTHAVFGFYVLREESYTTEIKDGVNGGGNAYSVFPTVKVNNVRYGTDSTNRYYIGNVTDASNLVDPESYYPTLTFDYTRIKFDYDFTDYNGQSSNYSYSYSNGKITVTKTRNNETSEFVYDEISAVGQKYNILSLVFTEIGSYTFHFKYQYVGYVRNGTTAPIISEDINDVSMVIHGAELTYAKQGTEFAELRYYKLAKSNYSGTDYSFNVIVPNGYSTSWKDDVVDKFIAFNDKKPGIAYSLEGSSEKAGKILEKKDALKSNHVIESEDLGSVISGLTANDYVSTNQSSLNIINNATFTTNSFYFYSSQPITDISETYTEITNMSKTLFDEYVLQGVLYKSINGGEKQKVAEGSQYDSNPNITYYEINKKPFTNLANSFTKKGGYYLVVLEIDPDGSLDSKYYQVFAFRYMSDEVSLTLKSNGRLLSSNDFTKDNIIVSWNQPGVFDKKIQVEYYYALNDANITVAEMKGTKSTIIPSGSYAGFDVGTGNGEVDKGVGTNQFARYLFKVSSAGGESATYTLVTIDKEPIQDVCAYLIQKAYSGANPYYTAVRNNDGSLVATNGLLSGLATLNWKNKSSGANIKVKYTLAQFVKSSLPDGVWSDDEQVGILNGYTLANSFIQGTVTKNKDQYLNIIDEQNKLSISGVYVFELEDQAGNVYKYAMIIDNTEAYFYIDGNYLWKDSKIYSNSTDFTATAAKYIELGTLSGSDILHKFLRANGNTQTPKGQVNNEGTLFASTSGLKVVQFNGKFYLSVENRGVYAYHNGQVTDVYSSNFGTMELPGEGENSRRRYLYIVSANQYYSTDVQGYLGIKAQYNKSQSYIRIEINPDQSQLYVYYSNQYADDSILSANGDDLGGFYRIETNETNPNASGLNYNSFSVILSNDDGENSFEIKQISYKYYKRINGNYNLDNPDVEEVIYSNTGTVIDRAVIKGNRLYYTFGSSSLETDDGLYIITREYDIEKFGGKTPENDKATRTYCFIVDKESIIDEANGIGKGNILNLLETENNIDLAEYIDDYYSNKGRINPDTDDYWYAPFIDTNKVPAVESVPAYKFYDYNNGEITNISDYDAGRLVLEIYYVDKYNQFKTATEFKDAAYLIYRGNPNIDGSIVVNNTFNNAIQAYLIENNYAYVIDEKTTIRLSDLFSSSNKNWTFVPGDYVYILKDNVQVGAPTGESTYPTNREILAYRINKEIATAPTVEIKVGGQNPTDEPIINGNRYNIVTNQEYIKVTIPTYDNNKKDGVDGRTYYADIDNSYVVIGGKAIDVEVEIYNKYNGKGNDSFSRVKQGTALLNESYDGDGNLTFYLNTYLKDENGVNVNNFSKTTKYTLTIRYKIIDSENKERYKACYVAYENGVRYEYYEATYIIEIDRVAPAANIDRLKSSDKLLVEYLKENNLTALNSNSYIENNNVYTFVNRYDKYYETIAQSPNLKYLYAFMIDQEFTFSRENGETIYYREYEPDSALTWSTSSGNVLTGNLQAGKYYEIIEVDIVGNICQYLVYVTGGLEKMEIKFDDTSLTELKNKPLFDINSIEVATTGSPFYRVVLWRLRYQAGNSVNVDTLVDTITTIASLNEDSGVVNQLNQFKSLEDAIKAQLKPNTELIVGNYQLMIYSQTSSDAIVSVPLNLYSITDLEEGSISADELINRAEKRIYFSNARKLYNGIMYYLTEISVKKGSDDPVVYRCVPSEGWIFKKVGNAGLEEVGQFVALENGVTYQIVATNLMGEISSAWYNSDKDSFYSINFIDTNGFDGYYSSGDYYYTINDTNIRYDKNIFTHYRIDDGEEHDSVTEMLVFDKVTDGNVKSYKIELIYKADERSNKIFYLTIDKRATQGDLRLRDLISGEDRSEVVNVGYNIGTKEDYQSVFTGNEKFTSGEKTLTWNRLINDYFDYSYMIVRKNADGTFETITRFTPEGVFNIKPDEKYADEIWLIANVMPKGQDTIIGNKVYGMKVKAKSNYYYMVTLNGEEIKNNSTFVYSDVQGLTELEKEGSANINVLENYGNVPLYVTNQELIVSPSADYVLEWTTFTKTFQNRELKIYYVTSSQTKVGQAFGIYTIKSTTEDPLDPISELKIYKNELTVNSESITNSKTVDYQPKIYIKQSGVDSDFNKNPIVVSYYYFIDEEKAERKVLVPTYNKDSKANEYTFEIKGIGPYILTISDLAGNIHYVNQNEEFKINVLTNIAVVINDEAYVEGAYYNKPVNVKVAEVGNYDATTLKATITRNGKEIGTDEVVDPKDFDLTLAGNYEIKITANLKNKAEGDESGARESKTIRFTIVNPNEANDIFDFTPILRYKINSIISEDGQDFTALFNNLMSENGVGSVKYVDVLYKIGNTPEYVDLSLTSGLKRFTVNYTVRDEAYPDRNIETVFAMNDEKPTITCSLNPGETTKKSFSISYNPGLIYTQIGESNIYINDTLIYRIDDKSPNEIISNEFSFNTNGAGDYQIRLETDSGIIKSSYVVTIKAPLNTSAIIIIVVVSVVVVGVIVTIIILRKKMKIR